MQNKGYVTYEDFGAVGDGVCDDMPAIVRAHEYANSNGLPVRACDGATYYIGGEDLTATVMTDVNFGTAKFILDDTNLKRITADIFMIRSDFEEYTPKIESVRAGQKKIDFPHTGNTYVRVYNAESRIFRRKGENANNGVDANECFTVDADGNIGTVVDLDYPAVSKVYARCIDDKPICIEGGIFTTIANKHERVYKYHCRGFRIKRCNVTLKNITHYIEGEGDDGAPYNGFFTVTDSVNVTIRDCLLTPHKTYMTKDSTPGHINKMGTYELNLNASIGVKLIGVKQSRDIMDTRYWGLIGTNFCKNIYIEGCEMSRFDAHMGVSGATIRSSRLGHQCLALIGYGDFCIEDSYVVGHAFINLRDDYGSIWRGNITVKRCVWQPLTEHNNTVIRASNTQDHDFGYVCTMPENIVIDGLRILDGEVKPELDLYILPDYDPTHAPNKPYPYVTTKRLSAKGIKTVSGKTPLIYKNAAQYEDLDYEIE